MVFALSVNFQMAEKACLAAALAWVLMLFAGLNSMSVKYRRYSPRYKRLPGYRSGLFFGGQESYNADTLEKENPNYVFYRISDLYEYFKYKC